MRIAVIGGGASGIVAAWLLDRAHEVTVFERETVPGGTVRTLGGNAPCTGLPADVRLDAGVIEFERKNFPRFHALMDELGVEVADVPGSTGLFLANGSAWHAPERLAGEFPGWLGRLGQGIRHLPIAAARRRFLARTASLSSDEVYERPVAAYLDDGVFGTWAKLLLMYAYSTPFEKVREMGAALAIPTLRAFVRAEQWTRVVGGVWTYFEQILERFRGKLVLNARIESITRGPEGVRLQLEGELPRHFDALVLATPPHQVLQLLVDASAAEQRRFGAWQANHTRTLIHTDTTLYERRGLHYYSEFDLFQTPRGVAGYNAYLNRLCGLPDDGAPHYSMTFGIEEEIDPEQVLHVQSHTTPLYTVEALRWREEVIAANGEDRTWFAGAWLGDGLHEGAVRSAERVALGLGGRAIGGG